MNKQVNLTEQEFRVLQQIIRAVKEKEGGSAEANETRQNILRKFELEGTQSR